MYANNLRKVTFALFKDMGIYQQNKSKEIYLQVQSDTFLFLLI